MTTSGAPVRSIDFFAECSAEVSRVCGQSRRRRNPCAKGATPTPVINDAGKVTGLGYTGGSGGNGLSPDVTGVRIMNPTSEYPNGYVTYMRGQQGANPSTGKPISDSDPMRHIPLSPPKPVLLPNP